MKKVATDIGGTFTDLVCFSTDPNGWSEVTIAKSTTTPSNFEKGIMNSIAKTDIDLEKVSFFVHGTTVVINALTEKKGVKTALITTKGFRDVLEIARSNRPDLFNFNFQKQPPFVPRYLIFEIPERIDYQGNVTKKLVTSKIDQIVRVVTENQVEAIAICLINAYKNPSHEKKLEILLKQKLPETSILASHTITREWREYERTSTVVASAYVSPIATQYLDHLNDKIKENGFQKELYIMQSNGGLMTLQGAKANPISIVESGPVGGMLGGAELGKELGFKDIIVLDIGGTTAKCSLVKNGKVTVTTDYFIDKSKTQAGYPILTPVIDIVEIGNGGGSKAWVDSGGKLHVGPQSAGADPGPSSYGLGGKDFTTTDAHLHAGFIHKDFFLGGDRKPDFKAIDATLSSLSNTLKLPKEDVAKGVLKIANANMINALRIISTNKGHDPRDFALVVIGGGGPLHGVFLAHELQISTIIVPNYAGVFSAFGMLKSDFKKDYLRTEVVEISEKSISDIRAVYNELMQSAKASFEREGFHGEQVVFKLFADIRYRGQEHYVKVKLPKESATKDTLVDAFDKEHEALYTFRLDVPRELVNFHVTAMVPIEKPNLPCIDQRVGSDSPFDSGEVDFLDFGMHSTSYYQKDDLKIGSLHHGPAIIAEVMTSTVVPPNYTFYLDKTGNLMVRRK